MAVGVCKTAEWLKSEFSFVGLANPKFQLGAIKRSFHKTGTWKSVRKCLDSQKHVQEVVLAGN